MSDRNGRVIYLDDGTSLVIDPGGHLVGILSHRDLLSKPNLLDQAREMIKETHQQPDSSSPRSDMLGRFASLTPREREVMGLMLAAKHTKQIASEMQISAKTVDFHRKNILDKFEVDDSLKLIRLIFELQVTCLEPAIS